MHKKVAQKQLITWGNPAHKLLAVSSITVRLCADLHTQFMLLVVKLAVLSSPVRTLSLAFSTAVCDVFVSVSANFLPTIHRPYNNDNKNIRNFLIIN